MNNGEVLWLGTAEDDGEEIAQVYARCRSPRELADRFGLSPQEAVALWDRVAAELVVDWRARRGEATQLVWRPAP